MVVERWRGQTLVREGGREERRPVLLSRGRRERREGERKREFLSMRGIPFSVPLPSPTLQ